MMVSRHVSTRAPDMPTSSRMQTINTQFIHAPVNTVFAIARAVEDWPQYLPHYRWVRYLTKSSGLNGVVGMSANRPFGSVNWPTWWQSNMWVNNDTPAIRFRHIAGITTGMEVEWSFTPTPLGTVVRILHCWEGPGWPIVGGVAAVGIIGPVFVHDIASRTLAGLAHVCEQIVQQETTGAL